MMGESQILLSDESSLGLSPILVEEFIKPNRNINEEGTRIPLIGQNAKKALFIAAKGYVLQKGEIVMKGNRSELFQSDVIQKAYLRG